MNKRAILSFCPARNLINNWRSTHGPRMRACRRPIHPELCGDRGCARPDHFLGLNRTSHDFENERDEAAQQNPAPLFERKICERNCSADLIVRNRQRSSVKWLHAFLALPERPLLHRTSPLDATLASRQFDRVLRRPARHGAMAPLVRVSPAAIGGHETRNLFNR